MSTTDFPDDTDQEGARLAPVGRRSRGAEASRWITARQEPRSTAPFPIRVIREIRGYILRTLLLGMLTLAGGVGAATLTVTNLADSGRGTLRQRIAEAQPNDTIDFAVTGTITLTNGELVIQTNLTIQGPGATNLILRAAPDLGVSLSLSSTSSPAR